MCIPTFVHTAIHEDDDDISPMDTIEEEGPLPDPENDMDISVHALAGNITH